MTCDRCGAPLDPDITHTQHEPDCDHDWCDCPTYCADCCQDPYCPIRDREIT